MKNTAKAGPGTIGPGRRILEALRRMVRECPLPYKAYLRLTGRSGRSTFPNPDTDLHLTGFPRSANTFATRLVERAAPDLRLSTHIHAVASLRLAMRHGIPTIVMVRDPLGTVSSALVRSGLEPGAEPATTRWLADYNAYHRFIARHRDHFMLLPFETVTKHPERLLTAVDDLCPGRLRVPGEDAGTVHQEVVESMEEANKRRSAIRSSIPNAEKAARKRDHGEYLKSHPLYAEARILYEVLIGRSGNQVEVQ